MPKRSYYTAFGGTAKRRYRRKKSYKKKRYYKRRRYSRRPNKFNARRAYRSNRNKYTTGISRFINPETVFPRQVFTKFRYVGTLQLTPASSYGSVARYVYRGNSIYDPVNATGGRTVYGYTLLDSYFNKYTVMASKITVTFRSQSDDGVRIYVLPTINAAVSPPSSEDALIANQTAIVKYLPMRYAAHQEKKISMYRTTRYMTQDDIDDDSLEGNYNGASSSNPTNQWYWIVGALSTPATATSSNTTIYCDVKITYYTKLHAPVRVTGRLDVPT